MSVGMAVGWVDAFCITWEGQRLSRLITYATPPPDSVLYIARPVCGQSHGICGVPEAEPALGILFPTGTLVSPVRGTLGWVPLYMSALAGCRLLVLAEIQYLFNHAPVYNVTEVLTKETSIDVYLSQLFPAQPHCSLAHACQRPKNQRKSPSAGWAKQANGGRLPGYKPPIANAKFPLPQSQCYATRDPITTKETRTGEW